MYPILIASCFILLTNEMDALEHLGLNDDVEQKFMDFYPSLLDWNHTKYMLHRYEKECEVNHYFCYEDMRSALNVFGGNVECNSTALPGPVKFRSSKLQSNNNKQLQLIKCECKVFEYLKTFYIIKRKDQETYFQLEIVTDQNYNDYFIIRDYFKFDSEDIEKATRSRSVPKRRRS